jgi:hypothetical protein
MNDLVRFFWDKIYYRIDQNDRFNTVLEFDDVLLVNFDCLYERERCLRAVDQLLFYLHKMGNGKKFIFISEDGAILEKVGAVDIITDIVKTFNLTENTCAVICREHIDITGVTVHINDSIPYWCHVLAPTIYKIPIPQGNFTKKFAVWFNRGTLFRLQITKHLYEKYKNDSIISYQESGVLVDRKMTEYYTELIDWANQNTPIVYDQIFPNREYTHKMIVGDRHPYEEYCIEVVCETDILGTSWITEKTIKNLYIGKPFILMSGPGTLAKLQSYGFKTFSPWIDESYDTILNHSDRLNAILIEIDRVADLDLLELHKNILPILEHNRQVFTDLVKKFKNISCKINNYSV